VHLVDCDDGGFEAEYVFRAHRGLFFDTCSGSVMLA
jgi:hypothetical protein